MASLMLPPPIETINVGVPVKLGLIGKLTGLDEPTFVITSTVPKSITFTVFSS